MYPTVCVEAVEKLGKRNACVPASHGLALPLQTASEINLTKYQILKIWETEHRRGCGSTAKPSPDITAHCAPEPPRVWTGCWTLFPWPFWHTFPVSYPSTRQDLSVTFCWPHAPNAEVLSTLLQSISFDTLLHSPLLQRHV